MEFIAGVLFLAFIIVCMWMIVIAVRRTERNTRSQDRRVNTQYQKANDDDLVWHDGELMTLKQLKEKSKGA